MVDSLDWGSVQYKDITSGRYAVDEGGRLLFFIRNGNVEFPKEDVRKILPFSSGISAVGRLNTNATSLDVGIQQPLSSSDEQRFNIIFSLRLKVKNSADARKIAAKNHASLENEIKTETEKVAISVLREFPYREIFFSAPNLIKRIKSDLFHGLKDKTSYLLLGFSYEVESEDLSVDEALRFSQREMAEEERRVRNEQIDIQRINRERANQIEDARHADLIKLKQEETSRKITEENAILKLKLEEAEALLRIDIIKKTLDVSGDPLDILAIKNPELFAQVRLNADTMRAQVERAKHSNTFKEGQSRGLIEGVRAVIKMQDLGVAPVQRIEITKKMDGDEDEAPE